MESGLMTIGEIAEFYGVSRKAMRIYEKKGIIKPVRVNPGNGYRYYSAEQVEQLNALIELKTLGFSLDEIKNIIDGHTAKTSLIQMLQKKRQAWQEAMDAAKYKGECLDHIIRTVESSRPAERIAEMTEEERAWLLVKMVCVEEAGVRQSLSEALWL